MTYLLKNHIIFVVSGKIILLCSRKMRYIDGVLFAHDK